jgi:protein-L-isoaspartate(D-aspartate) O-methyltransferase
MGEAERERMVRHQIAGRGIGDPRVLDAMRAVPREAFVPEAQRPHAYDDNPLPIGEGQTISQPYIVARMAEAAAIAPTDHVLEVGAGSGYAAAILSRLAARVHAIERLPALADRAGATLRARGFDNVTIRAGDGTLGWSEAAPFDAIIVSAGGPSVPEALRAQLAPGGRLVMPVGSDPSLQRLIRLTRSGESWQEDDLGPVRFVPLIGAQGWPG